MLDVHRERRATKVRNEHAAVMTTPVNLRMSVPALPNLRPALMPSAPMNPTRTHLVDVPALQRNAHALLRTSDSRPANAPCVNASCTAAESAEGVTCAGDASSAEAEVRKKVQMKPVNASASNAYSVHGCAESAGDANVGSANDWLSGKDAPATAGEGSDDAYECCVDDADVFDDADDEWALVGVLNAADSTRGRSPMNCRTLFVSAVPVMSLPVDS